MVHDRTQPFRTIAEITQATTEDLQVRLDYLDSIWKSYTNEACNIVDELERRKIAHSAPQGQPNDQG